MHRLWWSRIDSMSQRETKNPIWVVSGPFSCIPKCSSFERHMYTISCKSSYIICKPQAVVSYACIMHFEDHDHASPGCHLQHHILCLINIHAKGESFHKLTTTPCLVNYLDTSLEGETIAMKTKIILELARWLLII